jgi:ribose 5-phosphate isomerase RpiB
MPKRYATTYSTGYAEQTSSPHEAANWRNWDDQQTFALSGKPVSAEEFFAAARAAVQEAWDKKAQTHKRVRVLHGSSVASYVEKWVRK